MERIFDWNKLSAMASSAKFSDQARAAKMRADTANERVGDLDGCDCKLCRNRGSVAYPREDGTLVFRDCSCMPMRRCVWEMERSGLKDTIRECTFEAYLDTQPWQKALKRGAMAYAQKPEGWLLLCGQSGSGKTHLCTAVCRQRLLAGEQVRYMPWREQTAGLKAAQDSEQRAQTLRALKTAQILYIDDLYKSGSGPDGVSRPTAADVGIAFELINYRYTGRLPTIISTEKTPQELVAIDEATGSRIVEMAGQNAYCIGFDPKRNYRLRAVSAL